VTIGALVIIWYLPSKLISQNFLFDSLSALSLMIAFCYALTGIARDFYYRHELLKSAKNHVFIGVAPLIGAAILIYLFVKSLVEWSDPANSASGESWFGWAPPAVIGIGFLLLGVVLLFIWRKHRREPFFKRHRETANPAVLD
jgi:phosphatidylserine synthase